MLDWKLFENTTKIRFYFMNGNIKRIVSTFYGTNSILKAHEIGVTIVDTWK